MRPSNHFYCLAALSACLVAIVPLRAQAQRPPQRDSIARRDSLARDSISRRSTALPTMQVTASAVATDVRRIAQPTATLAGSALRRANAASLGETLEQVPGVRSLSMTSGIGKPVIRGLTNNRVVTLANGQRTETQQWGHDHSPNVESADAERLEVVKGPASVLYGSDALGGVVNVVRRPLPHADADAWVNRGRLALAWNSATMSPSGTLVGEGARGAFGWRLAGTSRRAENLRTPSGPVANTGNVTGYVEAAAGWRSSPDAQDNGGRGADFTVTTSSRDERIRIADNPLTAPGYTGRQRIRTERGTIDANVRVGGQRLQWQLGLEQNRRAEFDNGTTTNVTLGLQSQTSTSFLHWHHAPVSGFSGIAGVAVQDTRFRTFGNATLIPDNRASSIGVYAFEQRQIAAWSFSIGARQDWRSLTTPGNEVLDLPPSARRFSALTGTVGAVYRATSPVSLAFNVARGFRAPSASDLFANGFHEGTRAYEIGKSDLRVESSVNTDVGVRLRTSRVTGEFTTYVNNIRDYIYLAPVGEAGRALDSLQVRQGNARLIGAEAGVNWSVGRGVSALVTSDVVQAKNTADGTALPFVPPMRAAVTLRWDERAPGRYLLVTSEYNARQSRTFRQELAPPAWSLLSAGTGLSRITPRGLVHVDVTARNILNTRYRDFMSRYKEFADGAGRSLVVRLSTDF